MTDLRDIAAFAVADFRHAKCIFNGGSNIAASLPCQWQDAKKAMPEGAKLIVVDPRRTEIAEKADLRLQIMPGSDGARAMSMLRIDFSQTCDPYITQLHPLLDYPFILSINRRVLLYSVI